MKSILARFLFLGVPGLCFVVFGALNGEYPIIAVGGILAVDAVYGLSRKHGIIVDSMDRKGEGLSLLLAGVIGASFAITGFLGHGYLLGAVGIAILIGALLRLCGRGLVNRMKLIDGGGQRDSR